MRLKLVKDGRLNTCVYLCSLLKSHQYGEGIFFGRLRPSRSKREGDKTTANLEPRIGSRKANGRDVDDGAERGH